MLRALFECTFAARQAVVCADASSNFLVITREQSQTQGHWVVDDFLLALGHGHSFLMAGEPIDQIEAHYATCQPIKQVKVEMTRSAEGICLIRLTTRGKWLFQKTHEDPLEAAMMGDAHLAALSGWQLTRSKDRFSTKAVVVAQRANATHSARILRLIPDQNPEPHGLVLEVWSGQERILTRFGVLPRLVAQGNAFVPSEGSVVYRQRSDIAYFGNELEIQLETAAPSLPLEEGTPLFEYVLHGVRTAVVPLRNGNGYRIDVFVAGQLIGTLWRDMGRGNHPFPLPRAIHEAQDLLKSLQGWSVTMP